MGKLKLPHIELITRSQMISTRNGAQFKTQAARSSKIFLRSIKIYPQGVEIHLPTNYGCAIHSGVTTVRGHRNTVAHSAVLHHIYGV